MKSTVKESKYVVKGAAPYYNNSNDAKYQWPDRDKITDVDESVSGKVTVTCRGITDMGLMFFGCPHITKLDASKLDTSKVTNMSDMFNNCPELTSLDVSGFNTSKVTNMRTMFNYCPKLAKLDVSGFDTSKVTNMSYMFDNCSSLTTIEGVIDMKSCKYYENMFHNCPKLKGVKIKNPPLDFESISGLSKSQYIVVF